MLAWIFCVIQGVVIASDLEWCIARIEALKVEIDEDGGSSVERRKECEVAALDKVKNALDPLTVAVKEWLA